jgi:hypothetical protein
MFNPGEVVCEFCMKTISRDATKHVNRMNKRADEQQELIQNLVSPGPEEDVKKELWNEHYADSHDASTVWAHVDDKKGGSKKRR